MISKKLFFLIVVVLVIVYLQGAIVHSNTVNTDLNKVDQNGYIEDVTKIHKDNYWYLGGRNRMPLYPYLQALFYTPLMSDEALFQQGKLVNIFLSLFLLLFLYLVVSKYLDKLSCITFILLTMFTLFIFKAGYFQVELLFYFFSFISFIYLYKSLTTSNWKNSALAGVLVAVTYLLKGTILMGFIIYIVFSLLKLAHTGYRVLKDKQQRKVSTHDIKKALVSTLIAPMVFLILTSPYLLENKRIVGRYFYNVNTNSYIWYNSWDEVKAWTHNNGIQPPSEMPNFRTYINSHTSNEIINRELFGVFVLFTYIFLPLIYSSITFVYLFFYFGWLGYIVGYDFKYYLSLVKREFLSVAFIATYFTGYFLVFAWYVPIGPGPRFLLSLYLPLMFCVLFLLSKSRLSKAKRSYVLFELTDLQVVHIIVLLLLVANFNIDISRFLLGSTQLGS